MSSPTSGWDRWLDLTDVLLTDVLLPAPDRKDLPGDLRLDNDLWLLRSKAAFLDPFDALKAILTLSLLEVWWWSPLRATAKFDLVSSALAEVSVLSLWSPLPSTFIHNFGHTRQDRNWPSESVFGPSPLPPLASVPPLRRVKGQKQSLPTFLLPFPLSSSKDSLRWRPVPRSSSSSSSPSKDCHWWKARPPASFSFEYILWYRVSSSSTSSDGVVWCRAVPPDLVSVAEFDVIWFQNID